MANKTAGSQVLELSPSQSVKQIFNEYLWQCVPNVLNVVVKSGRVFV